MKKLRQTLAVLLAVVMLIGIMPFSAIAESNSASFTLSTVNGAAYDATQVIRSGDSIGIDIVLKSSEPQNLKGFILGYSFDSDALTLVKYDYDAALWKMEATQSGDVYGFGGRYKSSTPISSSEYVAATIQFTVNDSFTGETSLVANEGDKNYFSIMSSNTVNRVEVTAEGTSFTVYENTDKTALAAALAEAADKEEEDYTPNTWAPFAEAKATAQSVYDNVGATQLEINAATDALVEKTAALIETANKLALMTAVNKARMEANKTNVYTQDSINALKAVINEAEDILDDDNVSQATVDAEVTIVNNAVKALVKNEITVTFLNAEGGVFETVQVVYGGNATAPATNPTKAADLENTYTFAGWEGDYTNVTAPVTVTPKFTATKIDYTVTFVDEDGQTELATQTYNYGDTVVPPTDPTKAADAQFTYTFAGWTPAIVTVAGSTTYTATYSSTVNKYTVTFYNEDGSVFEAKEWEYGETPYTEGLPAKAATDEFSYTFAGWDKDVEAVTGAAEYTATFISTTNQYAIIFLDEDGTQIGETQTLDYGASVTVPTDPTKAADLVNTYTFAGWDPAVEPTVKGAATYRATYTATKIDYTVKFVDEDGTEIAAQTGNYGDAVTIPADPTKAADAQYTYTFAGWEPAVVTTIEGSATYTATYSSTVNKYTVTFYNEDGSVFEAKEWEYGTIPTTEADPTKAADAQYTYTFAGWDKEIAAVTGAAEYTAVFTSTVNAYDVTFLNDDGSEFAKTSYNYGEVPTAPEGTPTKASDDTYYYTFKEWSPAFAEVIGATTYTATFEAHYLDADYTAVNAAAEAAAALEASDYTDVSYLRVFTALGAVDYSLKINEQATVDAYAATINAAIAALVSDNAYKAEYAKCATTNNNAGLFTADSFAAFEAAFAALGAEKDFNTEEATQAEVDAATKALKDAYALLEAASLSIEGAKDAPTEETLLTSSNTSLTTTLLEANDGGAGTAELKFYDVAGNLFENTTKRIGTGFKVELLQFGEVKISKTIVIYGDINGDGQVSLSDVRLARKMALSTEGFTAEQILAAKCGGADIDVDAVIALAMAL